MTKSKFKKTPLFISALCLAALIFFAAVCGSVQTVSAAQDAEAHFSYNFADTKVREGMLAYFQSGSGAGSAEQTAFDANWQVNKDGDLVRVNNLGGSDIATSYATLYFDKKFKCFEINYQIAAPMGTVGWSGIMFNKQNLTSSFIFDGDSAFVRTDLGHAFLWGQSVGAATDENTALAVYSGFKWNDIKVKVYGTDSAPFEQNVEFWVNGSKVLHNTRAKAIIEGSVSLFTTTGTASFRNVSINLLDKQGTKIDYVPVQSVTLGEHERAAKIGDTLELNATLLPLGATEKRIEYISGDLSTVVVSPEGKVTFLNTGEVSVKAVAKDNPLVFDEIVFNVTAKVDGIKIANKLDKAKVGESYKLNVSVLPAGSAEVTFSSSDDRIAEVSADGTISFKASGTVEIKVRGKDFQGIMDSMTVTVEGGAAACGALTFDGGFTASGGIVILALISISAFLALRKRGKGEVL